MKVCAECGNGKARAKGLCRKCYRRDYEKAHPEHRERELNRKRECYGVYDDDRRNYDLIRRYGITVEQYNELLACQGGVCAICKQPSREGRLAIDHDHETGHVRGLLCGPCNRAIGLLKDSPVLLARAIEYLSLGDQ